MSAPPLDVAAVRADLRRAEACLARGDSRGAVYRLQGALAAVVSHMNGTHMTVYWGPVRAESEPPKESTP